MTQKNIRLNLGSGERVPGFINIDWKKSTDPDVVHDLNIIPYPFGDSVICEIRAFHILEHLNRPFAVMSELHRILKPGGKLHIKVPHFSRGFGHAEHFHGFDVTFPNYFNRGFIKSGYNGFEFALERLELHWMSYFHLLVYMGYGGVTISILKILNYAISWLANLSPRFCSRIWCFWVGGFEEIAFVFICKK